MKKMKIVAKKRGVKRWAKGESSSSNPTLMKYRKAINVFPNTESDLTSKTLDLLKLDEANLGIDYDDNDDNISVKSRFSFSLSNVPGNMDSQFYKDCLAIVAALTEIIRSNGGQGTNTEYFAAMMTFLEKLDDMELMNPAIYITRVGILKGLPESVLKSQFSTSSVIFVNILSKCVDSENIFLLRNVIYCLSVFLRVQDIAIWQNSSTSHVYKTLLDFVLDTRPKIRKETQRVVTSILTENNLNKKHPAIDMTAEFCITQLKEFGGPNDSTSILYTIGLLKQILHTFPLNRVKTTCESILQLMTLGNLILKTSSLQTLFNLFVNRPNEETLTASLTAKLITALYNYQPQQNDVQLWKSWLNTMQQAHFHLKRLDENLCHKHVTYFVQTIVTGWTSEHTQIHLAIAECLKSLLFFIVEPLGEKIQTSNRESKVVEKIFECVENALQFQCHSAWKHVLNVLAVFFQVAGNYGYAFMIECVRTLGSLCESQHFSHVHETHFAIGMAIRTMGPRRVLLSIPIELDEANAAFKHGWILPILRNNIRKADFSYFTSECVGLINILNKKASEAETKNETLKATSLRTLEFQMWSLLPGFCKEPQNFVENFKSIAKFLGMTIQTRPDLRIEILASVRILVQQNDESVKSEMKKFSKNYLPIFFNIYTSNSEESDLGSRRAVFDTIKVYLKIADSEVCTSLYGKCMDKLTNPETTDQARGILLDLILSLLSCISQDEVKNTYKTVVEYVKSDNSTLRKKVYRILEELCSCPSDACCKFVDSSLSDLRIILGESIGASPPATKAARFRCLSHLFKRVSTKHQSKNKKYYNFAVKLLPEVILRIKEPSERARSSALNLIVEIGQCFFSTSEKPENEGIQAYLELIAAGFVSSQEMIGATTIATAHVLKFFSEFVTDLDPIVKNCCMLMQFPNRRIIDDALILLKTILRNFSESSLMSYVENIISGLCSIPNDVQRAFRFKTKEIYTKLVKKFGFYTVFKLVPEKEQKLIKKINKDLIRQKNQRMSKDQEKDENDKKISKNSLDDILENSDKETDDDEDVKSKSNKTWLHETTQTQMIDFLDPAVSQNISTTKPNRKRKLEGAASEDFALSSDGKLIITDDQEEVENESQGEEPDGDSKDVNVNIKNKKEYKAGGTGIHRSLATGDGKSRKKKCDARVKGSKYEPYQYIPLSVKKLNKRKKNKVDNLIKSAQKGSGSGRKMRKRKK